MNVAIVRVPTIIDPTSATAPICPSLGLAYLKGVVTRFTKNITVVDAVGNLTEVRKIATAKKDFWLLGQSAEEIAWQIPKETHLILISIMFSQDWPYMLHVLSELRRRCPGAGIVAGGEHITAVPEFSMNTASELDLCVLGEGELILQEILERFVPGQPIPRDIAGTCSRDGKGGVIRNPRRARAGELNAIPRPDWDGFPIENYLSKGHGFGVNRGRSMPIMATRGCPYQCTFCSSPEMWTTAWRAREPADVLDEMKGYIKKFGAKNFDFYDLTFVIKREWVIEFANLLMKENLNITWQLPTGTRSEAIDREVAHLLNISGCRNLAYAPESGSPTVLTMIKKKIHIPRMIQSMKDSVAEDLSVKANIICGFPDENWKLVRETLGFIIWMAWVGIDDMSINQFSPYPGSELFEQLIKEGKIKLDAEYFESLSYHNSMTRSSSYSKHLTGRDIVIFKLLGMSSFYAVSFLRRPWRVLRIINNVYSGNETTRLEKSLRIYWVRWKAILRGNKIDTEASNRVPAAG